MPLNADEMIAALNTFQADDGYDENQARLYELMDGFKSLPDRERVMPAMFALMERFPDAYLGTPGPLVHNIESLGPGRYEQQLIDSVRRQPVDLNTWMVNRILNTNLKPEYRQTLLDLLRFAAHHPSTPKRVVESVTDFLERQAKRNIS